MSGPTIELADAAEVQPQRAPRPEPVVFGDAPGLFGWYHAPAQPTRGCAVVLCYPLHYEAICTHRAFRKLALQLAAAGFPTLRFDYAGTGDSPGDDSEPDRVSAWLGSIRTAVKEAKALSGASSCALFGLRTGALLAATAAAEPGGGVESLVLWATVSGRGQVREITAFGAMRASGENTEKPSVHGSQESAGFLLLGETLEELSKLEPARLARAPARDILLLDRDDIPGDTRLAKRWSELGAKVAQETVPGYLAMMAYPHLSLVPDAAWLRIVGHLSSLHPRQALKPGIAPAPAVMLTRSPAGAEVREEAIRFDNERLFGILSEPVSELGSAAPALRERTCLLLPTMASHHRVGANRLHVRWARVLPERGYATLRFDVSGTGDSEVNQTGVENAPYALDQAADLQHAMDDLAKRGYTRFVAAGICSGCYLIYHASLKDPRLSGNILVNPQTFHWKPGDTVLGQPSRKASFKSTGAYRRAFFQPKTWLRLLRGEVHAAKVLRELVVRLRERLQAPHADSEVLNAFRQLAARGTDTLLVFGSDDVGIDFIESHLGKGASKVADREHLHLVVVEGPERTFGQIWAQQELTDLLLRHLR